MLAFIVLVEGASVEPAALIDYVTPLLPAFMVHGRERIRFARHANGRIEDFTTC